MNKYQEELETIKDVLMSDETLKTLTPREEKVIRLLYGLDDNRARTLEEVGRELGVTRERIRQIEAKVIRRVRYQMKAQKEKSIVSKVDIFDSLLTISSFTKELAEKVMYLDVTTKKEFIAEIRDLIDECIQLLKISGENTKAKVLIKLLEFKDKYLDETKELWWK